MIDTVDTPWIKLKDFEQTSYWISGMNTATEIPLQRNGSIEMGEVSATEITLKVPIQSCALNHLVLIKIQRRNRVITPEGGGAAAVEVPDLEIEFTAKVVEAEAVDKKSKLIRIKLLQVDEYKWKSFLNDFTQRQAQVRAVVKNIQGE